ncbi:MAG: DNA-3-methyladenine glycosylase I [Clostridia bacterium]|nr:DNA-3-methyladenine glycosylase I [Clostridia bacterium]
MEKQGCGWETGSEAMKHYHNERWGKPEHRDTELFAMLILEGAQAGLSWATILMREENYRAAFDGFDPRTVAEYGEEKIEALLSNPGIIRNRLKVRSAVNNARAFLRVQEEFGSFDRYIWHFTGGQTVDHHLTSLSDMPVQDALSDKVSRDLKKRGFTFVGPTIIYSYLQGIGVINDHLTTCAYR